MSLCTAAIYLINSETELSYWISRDRLASLLPAAIEQRSTAKTLGHLPRAAGEKSI